ncbi:hypothetical protein T484DRAFT_2017372, partial [Baffinella frigidus]
MGAGRLGGPRRLIWMSGWLFCLGCLVEENEGMQRNESLAEWRRQRTRFEPLEPDSRGEAEAGGGGRHEDCAEGMQSSQSLTEWRCQRNPHEPDSRGESGRSGLGDSSEVRAGGRRSASLVKSWRRSNREPHEPDNRGASEAGGAEGARGRPCGGGEHTDGRWVAKSAGTREAAPCCDAVKPEERDPAVCGPSGPREMPIELWNNQRSSFWNSEWSSFWDYQCFTYFWNFECFTGRRDFLVHASSNACSCKGWRDEWMWEARTCALASWDAAAFCHALGRRTILFIGDSTLQQSAVAVINAVTWDMWNATGCQQQVSFGASDTLIGLRLGMMNRGDSWTQWVNAF